MLDFLKQSFLLLLALVVSAITALLAAIGGLAAFASIIVTLYSPVMGGIILFAGLSLFYGMWLGPLIPVGNWTQRCFQNQKQAFLRAMTLRIG